MKLTLTKWQRMILFINFQPFKFNDHIRVSNFKSIRVVIEKFSMVSLVTCYAQHSCMN
jgi:hypothetical protein